MNPINLTKPYKLFDELHNAIFARPEVDADRVVALYHAYLAVLDVLPRVEPEVLGKYRLVQFFLLSVLRTALESDEVGVSFCQDPTPFMEVPDWEARLHHCFSRVLADLVIDLNAEIEERRESGAPFDYKRELKSQNNRCVPFSRVSSQCTRRRLIEGGPRGSERSGKREIPDDPGLLGPRHSRRCGNYAAKTV